ncbi:MAG: hypothetical protein M0Z52_08190 [Actinomycetota bacterium]|nr:hypothetical protein [Actinomycetota bacterium]
MRRDNVGCVPNISRNAVFTICPNCGFGNIQVVEQCKNCGYKDGMSLQPLAKETEIPDELKKEIKEYREAGLLRKVPKEVLIGLKLPSSEGILMAMKCSSLFYPYVQMARNDQRAGAGWFFMTTKEIIYYTGIRGWLRIDRIPYSEIKNLQIANRSFVFNTYRFLIINTKEASYKFIPRTLKRKWAGLYSELAIEPIVQEMMHCIDRRKQEMM